MSPRLNSVELAIQHVRDRGECAPVGSVNMGKGPSDIAQSKPVSYPRARLDVRTIVVVDELVPKRLAKRNPDNARKQNADDAGA